MTKKTGYSEKNIKVLLGLDSVRKKPGMYIGLTDSTGLATLIREVGDNAVDERKAGRGKSVTIAIDTKKNQVWVADTAEGMPVKNHTLVIEGKKVVESTMKSIVSRLHAGGKLEESAAYQHAGGTHGVGIKAVNALSKHFEVHTFRDGKWWATTYADSKEKKAVAKSSPPKLPFGLKAKLGTVVTFIPDMQFFDKGSKMPLPQIEQWCELAAQLNAKFAVKLAVDGKVKEWKYDNGVKDYLDLRVKALKATANGKPFIAGLPDVAAEIALAFTDAEGDNLVAYTNSIKNKNGGLHVKKLQEALFEGIKKYAGAKHKFRREDVMEGVVGIIDARLNAPKFSSQDKAELVDGRIEDLLDKPLKKAVDAFFAANKSLAKALAEKASSLRDVKAEFLQDKKALAELSKAKKRTGGLPTKLAAVNCSPDKREIFLVEGDSAGGTAKQARDDGFQEVLALKGKIINALKNPAAKVIGSDEVQNIFISLGFDPKAKNPLSNVRCAKLVMLTDPDVDGYHITTLVLSLISVFMPSLYGQIEICAVEMPEFAIELNDGKWMWAKTRKDLMDILPKGADPKKIKHIKGWGELDAEPLKQMAFDPKTRRLLKIAAPDRKQMARFKAVMGEDVSVRKELLGV